MIRIPEDEKDAWKRVAVLTIHEYILYICCAFVGLNNKLRNCV